jgi:hypothetical protein
MGIFVTWEDAPKTVQAMRAIAEYWRDASRAIGG